MYQNFALHNRLHGYLHKKKLEDVRQTIKALSDLAPEEVPEESKFLLEINFGDLNKSHIDTQQYWVIVIQAAITAGRRRAAAGRRAKRIQHKVNLKTPSRQKLGIIAVKTQIRRDQMHSTVETDMYFAQPKQTLTKYLKKRPHLAATFALAGSNKKLCKPD
jgi:hypothetical protein